MAELFHKLSPAAQKAMLEGPAIPPPLGVLPNFEHPPNRRALGWAITILCTSLSTFAVLLRMYSRIVCAKRVGIEDYLAVGALAVYGGFQYYVMSIAAYPGFFVHTWDIKLKALSGFLFNIIAGSTVHGVVIMLLKSAIILDLLRIFSPRGQRSTFFWTCHLLLWTNVLFYTICTFLEIFGCQPREKLWNKLIPGGHCININALTVASGAINLPSDLCIVLLPQRAIWRLNLSKRKKMGISAIFAVAILSSACVSAAVRLAHSVPLLTDRDILYTVAYTGVWIQAEMTAGFLILGFPALPKIVKSSPLLQRLFSHVKSWTGFSASKLKSESRKGLPSWYKPEARKRPRREAGWSDLEATKDESVVMQSLQGVRDDGGDGTDKDGPCFYENVEGIPQVHPRGADGIRAV
ncbi:hypothetical protein N0V90_011600 [Kalmusia sp. IMI 367209]|nr:hypothetical protein N0V90_011600 [Kalmusia sp. IMI 367209]